MSKTKAVIFILSFVPTWMLFEWLLSFRVMDANDGFRSYVSFFIAFATFFVAGAIYAQD